MADFALVFLPSARKNMRDILNYQSKFYPGTPGKFFDRLREQIDGLKTMPQKYEVYGDFPYYRKMVVAEYLVFYHIDDEKKRVEVHKILHGSQDIRRQLR
jgi:addiction module RelE/StbE family toxin